MATPILVISNCPPDHAHQVARRLLEDKLAACVNIIPGVSSLYWWEGKITEESESTLLIKSFAHLYPKLEKAITDVHPYSVPEIFAIPLNEVFDPYHAWMKDVLE